MLLKRLISTVAIACSLIFAVNAEAQVNWHKFSYFKNFGGLNDNISSTEIEDNEATDIQNVIFDTGGSLKKRLGFNTVPKTPNPSKVATGTTVAIDGLFFLKLDNGNRYLITMANSDGKATLMKKNYLASGGPVVGTWDNIDSPMFSSSYTNNYQADFCEAQNKLVVVDGTGTTKPAVWTGSGKAGLLTTSANLPNASIVKFYKNQLFLANNSSFPSRVWFSNLGDITTWTATDFFDVSTSDGSQVRSLIVAFNALYIFKDKSIWRLSGDSRDNFVLEQMVSDIGTLSNHSPQVIGNLIFFITQQNDIAVYDGGHNVQFISQKIRGTIGSTNFSRATNSIGIGFSTYKYVDYDFYASVTTGANTSNSQVLMFDTGHKAWTKFSGINANAWCVGDNDVGQNALYFGDYNGYVSSYPSSTYYDGNVATTAISAFYQTKWFKYPEISLGDKYWRLLKTYAISNDGVILNIECKSDFEASGKMFSLNLSSPAALWDFAVWDVDLWSGDSIIIGRDEVEKGVNFFQLKYSNSTVSQGFTIVGFETFIEGTERI